MEQFLDVTNLSMGVSDDIIILPLIERFISGYQTYSDYFAFPSSPYICKFKWVQQDYHLPRGLQSTSSVYFAVTFAVRSIALTWRV